MSFLDMSRLGDLLLRACSGMQHHLPVKPATFEPAATISGPDGAVVIQVRVLLIVQRDVQLGSKALDVFQLKLSDHLCKVIRHLFDHAQGTPLT